MRLAEELRRDCASLAFTAGGQSFGTTCSFGISMSREDETADEVLKKADIALYHAKATGRNRVCGGSQLLPSVAFPGAIGCIRQRTPAGIEDQ